jgi:hypothetical protein
MESETIAVAQILRLFRERPTTVWDLLPPSSPTRSDDIPLRDLEGALVGYARPVAADRGLDRSGV